MRRTGSPLAVAQPARWARCARRLRHAEVQFHHWPAETPAADNAADIASVQGLHAAAAAASKSARTRALRRRGCAEEPPPAPVTPADAPPLKTYDPLGTAQPLHLSIQRPLR